ncbi:TonB-dependent receptor plug domain-containing protein [Teredinibacter sp. KSP-S5-2]|uniref:TonB-dependent receptor plug domain-containing protein n=1 Tax=Teredinibacter sp. KSP-S5-2 TaxID=3034506 RepID=UPI0029345DF0|nr:TonB-dependent receptor [Teredinibacter sp. KSP-S5-2]WNO08494.1 TonB-dependent receptor [Teredinibacter sp. KSP-S5-2]
MATFANRFALSTLTVAILTHTLPAQTEEIIEETLVIGVKQRLYQAGMLKDSIQKTEVISTLTIEQKQASSITEAIEDAPGVRVNNECSMCGVKRVMVNGMRGEHTNVLIDGIPTHTMLSGFYGLDAATAAGIQAVEIARGAGASLIAPEAVGGTVNIVTKEASSNEIELDVAAGENNYKKGSLVATGIANNDTTRITAIAQYDHRDAYDGDNNGVGENPLLENQSITIKLSQDIGRSNNISTRYNYTESEVFGGPMNSNINRVKAEYFADPNYESDSLFENDDVRNRYIGKEWETTEWITSDRQEFYLTWLSEISPNLNFTLTTSLNDHQQDSFYEGFIYHADDEMQYYDLRVNYALNEDHLFTFGADARIEEMRSETNSTSETYVSDSFDYDTHGVYLQDTWTATENLEIALAVRIDQVMADFVDPNKDGTEIDETMVSPRLDARYSHTDTLTSRLAMGKGYRAPLSFFESDHGILDSELGFEIAIDELEKSDSATYALSYEGNRLSLTWSLAYTALDNMATLEQTEDGLVVMEQHEETASVFATDIAMTYQIKDNLSAGVTLESFHYNDEFKQAFGVVPIEQRAVISGDWDYRGWDFYGSATWVASRDLAEYGVPQNPTFDAQGRYAKSNTAPSYWILDLKVAKEFTSQLQIYFGVSNLLDYTQVNDMETPLFYEDGGFDVAHIYGPLRGREAYLGVKYVFQ